MATCPTCNSHYPDDVHTCPTDGATLVPDQVMAASDTVVPVGYTIGEYCVDGKIGSGGFGTVYSAVHPLIGKKAAIKVLHKRYSSDPTVVSRFIAEARAVNQIRHRNIIDIFSFGALEDGRQYYVMELLEGSTLAAHIEKKIRLDPEEAMPIFRGVARALDAAHSAGIAHRDLKPENIFLIFDEDGPFPVLLDFGIAKLLGAEAPASRTRTGTPLGTPYYMSPEQCRGRSVDHRSDLYSFGVVLFETLVGTLPYNGDDMMEVLTKHVSTSIPLPSAACSALPPSLDEPICAFLQKDPAKRPPSTCAGLEAIVNALEVEGRMVLRMTPDVSAARRVTTGGGNTGSGSQPRTSALADTVTKDEKVSIFTPIAPQPRRSTWVWSAMGAFALLCGGWLLWPKRMPAPPVTASGDANSTVSATGAAKGAKPLPTELPSGPDVAVSPSVAASSPSAPDTAAADKQQTVSIVVEVTPRDAEVFSGATKLRFQGGALKFPRGSNDVKLTFKARGFWPAERRVALSADSALRVFLVKMPAAVGAGTQKELEF